MGRIGSSKPNSLILSLAAIGLRCWGQKHDPLSSSPLPQHQQPSLLPRLSPFFLSGVISLSSSTHCFVSPSFSSPFPCIFLQISRLQTFTLHRPWPLIIIVHCQHLPMLSSFLYKPAYGVLCSVLCILRFLWLYIYFSLVLSLVFF